MQIKGADNSDHDCTHIYIYIDTNTTHTHTHTHTHINTQVNIHKVDYNNIHHYCDTEQHRRIIIFFSFSSKTQSIII